MYFWNEIPVVMRGAANADDNALRVLGIASASSQTIGLGQLVGGLVTRFMPAAKSKTASVSPCLSPFVAGLVARFQHSPSRMVRSGS